MLDGVERTGDPVAMSSRCSTAGELFSFERAEQRASGIFETTQAVFALAKSDSVTPAEAADRLAERRMRDIGRLRGLYLPTR